MDIGVRNTLLWIFAFIAFVLGSLVASVMLRQPSDEELRSLGYYRFDEPRPLTEISLKDHAGRSVTQEDLAGNWSLLFFGFTFCPDVCPTTLSVMNEAVRQMESPPRVVMVSVDPDRDTPEMLGRYVKSFNPSFDGYVGTFDETVHFTEQVNVAFGKVPGPDPASYLVDHTASIVVIDPNARYAGFIKAPHRARNLMAIAESFN